MSGREVAWRVLAQELLSSTAEEKGVGERAASHLLSPGGARMNRVLIVGALSPPATLGPDPAQPFLVARLTDPTGSVSVSAGNFQPRAFADLRAIDQDRLTRVIGKAHLYRGRTGPPQASIRAESVRTITQEEYVHGLLEAAEHTARRLAMVERVRSSPTSVREPEMPPLWLRAAREAERAYPAYDLAALRGSLDQVRAFLRDAPVRTPAARSPPTASGARITRARPSPPAAAPLSAAGRAEEAAFLDIIDELADGSADGYADLREAFAIAGRGGVEGHLAEELLHRLESTGVLEEPIVGKVRRA